MIGTNSEWRILYILAWLLDSKVYSTIVQKPVDTEVKVGDSTILKCSVSDASASVSWYHYPVGRGNEDLRYIYTDGQIFKSYVQRFRIEKDASTGAQNLVITQVEVGDAGRYVYQNNGDSQTAELIVLESSPVCISNINSRGFIGPNSCGLKKETIQLSCGVKYKGNVPPQLQWTRIKHNGSSSSIPETCDVFNGSITCNHSVEADNELNESYFKCQTNRTTSQYNCITETVRIPYLMENKTRIAKSIGDAVTCPANVNSFDCSYKWIWYDGDSQETVSESRTLTIDKEGLHRCETNCNIKEFKCTISTMRIKTSVGAVAPGKDTSTAGITGCIFGICLILLVSQCAIMATFIRRRREGIRNDYIENLKAELRKEMQFLSTRDCGCETPLPSYKTRNSLASSCKLHELSPQNSGPPSPVLIRNSFRVGEKRARFE